MVPPMTNTDHDRGFFPPAIPKIIHQAGPSQVLPAVYEKLRRHLIRLHRDWSYRFYDDHERREQVERHCPRVLAAYDAYPTEIQRVDLFRMVIVYALGGFYLDLDILCRKALDPLCGHRAVFAEEVTLSDRTAMRLGHREKLRVASYMFGAEAHHPFLNRVIEEMIRRADRPVQTENDVLESTGPGLLSTIYFDRASSDGPIRLLKTPGIRCPRCGNRSCQFGSYASHYHAGSWRWQGDAGRHGKADRAAPEFAVAGQSRT